MNIDRLKIIIDEWYEYIIKEDLDELEKDIEMPIKDFIIQLLQNMYDYYKDTIVHVPASVDSNSEYIIKPQNGQYTLEDFLINRLLRNISIMSYKKQYILPESHYDRTFGEVLYDKDRAQNLLKDVDQRRKLVAHELLHGLKTQFVDHNVFRSKDYYSLKEKLKLRIPQDVNDFSYMQGIEQNGSYSHIGLSIKKEPIDMDDIDEIFNEIDAIRFSDDKHVEIGQLENGLCIVLNNKESSNAIITNYAYIMERLLDKETLFVGMYIDPSELIRNINYLYTKIFQKNYNSTKSAIEIIIEQIDMIKRDPHSADRHAMLLETFYDCIKHNADLSIGSDQDYDGDISCLVYRGLLDLKDGRLKPYSGLSYCAEYESIRNKEKQSSA